MLLSTIIHRVEELNGCSLKIHLGRSSDGSYNPTESQAQGLQHKQLQINYLCLIFFQFDSVQFILQRGHIHIAGTRGRVGLTLLGNQLIMLYSVQEAKLPVERPKIVRSSLGHTQMVFFLLADVTSPLKVPAVCCGSQIICRATSGHHSPLLGRPPLCCPGLKLCL